MHIKNKFCVVIFVIGLILIPACSNITSSNKSSNLEQPDISLSFDNDIISVNNVQNLELIESWGQGNFREFTLSPDEKTLAVARTNGVYLYDSSSLEIINFISAPILQTYSLGNGLSFSADGTLLSIVYNDVMIWDLQENRVAKWIRNPIYDYQIGRVDFSPDGETLSVVSHGSRYECDGPSGNFALYNIESGNLLYNDYFCTQDAIYYQTFTTNGKFVYSAPKLGGGGYAIRTLNASTGELIDEVMVQGLVTSIDPSGYLALYNPINGNEPINILNLHTQKVIYTFDKNAREVLFLQGDDGLILVQSKDELTVYSRDEDLICSFGNKLSLWTTALHQISMNKIVAWQDDSIEIWGFRKCALSQKMNLSQDINNLYFTANGKKLVLNGYSESVLINSQNGEQYRTTNIQNPIAAIQSDNYISPAGVIASLKVKEDYGYSILIWDVASWNIINEIETQYRFPQSILLSSSGEYVAVQHSNAYSNPTQIWETGSGKLMFTWMEKNQSIVFSKDDKTIARSYNNSIFFVSLPTGELLKSLHFDDHVSEMVFSEDGRYIIIHVGSNLERWDLATYKRMNSFPEEPSMTQDPDQIQYFYLPVKNYSNISDLNLTSDNRLLIAIYTDNIDYQFRLQRIRFWDVETGQILMDKLVPFSIDDLALSPDGKEIITLSNGIVHVWRIKNGK
jgi:hypothetical protein